LPFNKAKKVWYSIPNREKWRKLRQEAAVQAVCLSGFDKRSDGEVMTVDQVINK
jgi:hypothetical protein